ncbi:unnamed protein product [Musa acuminata subsp. burmannicoides]
MFCIDRRHLYFQQGGRNNAFDVFYFLRRLHTIERKKAGWGRNKKKKTKAVRGSPQTPSLL